MYRKGAAALIMNKNQEFLLVNLKSFDEKYFTIPGGGLDEGETLEETVYREINEELGIEKKSLEFVGKSDLPHKFKFKILKLNRDNINYESSERYFFGFHFVGNDEEIKYRDGEVRTHKWVPFDRLGDYLLFGNQLEVTLERIVEIFPFFRERN